MKMLSLSVAALLGLSLAVANPVVAQDTDLDFVAPASLEEAVLPGVTTARFVRPAFVPPISLDEAVIRGVSTAQTPERSERLSQVREQTDSQVGPRSQVRANRRQALQRRGPRAQRAGRAAVRAGQRQAMNRPGGRARVRADARGAREVRFDRGARLDRGAPAFQRGPRSRRG